MDKVNILYCFDSKSWQMVAVSMESLLSNTNLTTHLTIYCMVVPGTKGQGKIKKIIKSHKNRASLVWREIDASENPFQAPEYSKWGSTTFYSLVAHRFFKDIDKILYLNPSTLIYHDLSELFNTDISDYALGAVPDMAPVNDDSSSLGVIVRDFSQKYLNNGLYYNGGVLLLNLKKMAECEKSLLDTNIQLRYPLQDLLNVALVGKIKTLPLKYNLAPGTPVPSHFSQEEAAEVNAGKHVIVDCYYSKPYDKQRIHNLVYEAFVKYAKNIGMTPEMFVKADEKRAEVKKTFVPHVSVRQGKILFFGMKISK